MSQQEQGEQVSPKYHSCQWPDPNQTPDEGSQGHPEQPPIVKAPLVPATPDHSENVSAVTDLKFDTEDPSRVLILYVLIGIIILGVLTGQLLLKLQESKIPINSFILGIQLSPSFYFPSNLLMFSDAEFNDVAAHFNCVNAWSKLPKYEERCFSYFESRREMREYLYFAKCLLERHDKEGALRLLSRTRSFGWPETNRYTLWSLVLVIKIIKRSY